MQSNWISPTRSVTLTLTPRSSSGSHCFRIDCSSRVPSRQQQHSLHRTRPQIVHHFVFSSHSAAAVVAVLILALSRSSSKFLRQRGHPSRTPAIEATVKSATGADRRRRSLRHRLLRSTEENYCLFACVWLAMTDPSSFRLERDNHSLLLLQFAVRRRGMRKKCINTYTALIHHHHRVARRGSATRPPRRLGLALGFLFPYPIALSYMYFPFCKPATEEASPREPRKTRVSVVRSGPTRTGDARPSDSTSHTSILQPSSHE